MTFLYATLVENIVTTMSRPAGSVNSIILMRNAVEIRNPGRLDKSPPLGRCVTEPVTVR
jgi:hypothetical protein